jgi:hypothetical protein
MFNKNINEGINQDLHLADSDYRNLNLPKHEQISLKETIAQMQQSPLQPTHEENASLFPFHINLAQADVPANVPAVAEPSQDAVANDAVANDAVANKDAAQIQAEVVEGEDLMSEDPGVLLLPDTADEVIRIELSQENSKIQLPIDDDGSQDLYRIKHNNEGLVQDQPRDLGIPPVVYELPKTEFTFIREIPLTAPDSDNCCHSQVELSVTAYSGSGSLYIEGIDNGGEQSSGTTRTLYFDSYPTETVFLGNLTREVQYSSGSSAITEQRINDFTFGFTYTNCDEDGDGVLDSRLTFTFDNIFTYNYLVVDGDTSYGPTSNFFTTETIIIDAPQNDNCCSFELSINEVDFAYAMSAATSGGYTTLTADDVLGYFVNNYDDYFRDCDSNLYTRE